MRWFVLSLVLVGMFSSEVFAGEITTIKKKKSAAQQMRFMKNFDAKIKGLENYTVTYLEPGQKMSVSEAQKKADGLEVKLVSKKKS